MSLVFTSHYITVFHCSPIILTWALWFSCRRPNQRLILPLLMMTVFLRFRIVLKKKNQKMFYIRI